jgi:hypothetical protein
VKQKTAIEIVKQWFPEWQNEKQRLDEIDQWGRGFNPDVRVPNAATAELKRLIGMSKTNWLGLVVTTVAQTMFVDGYRSALPEQSEPNGLITGPWAVWLANSMQSRQIAVHRAALNYGYSFVQVLPGLDAFGKPMPVMRGLSPRKTFAVYANPAEDEWPIWYFEVSRASKDKYQIRVVDEVNAVTLECDSTGNNVTYISEQNHKIGVAPLVRYTNMLDLDGRTPGEVEPYIPLASRIDKTDYDRLVTQHFASWKKLWVAGMEKPENAQEANGIKLKMAQDDIIVSDNAETKFGAFPASELQGFISAKENDVETLAAVSQTPSFALTGKVVNLSADAIAAARASLDQKTAERKVAFGVSHDQGLRLAARINGDMVAANDFTAHVTWQDTSVRSLASAADALGKMAQMLGVPQKALWSLIPGVTKTDVAEWETMAGAQAERSPEGILAGSLNRQDV